MIISKNKNKAGGVIEAKGKIDWLTRHFGYLAILVFVSVVFVGYLIFLRGEINQYYNLQLTALTDFSSQLQSMNSYLAELKSTINQFNQFSENDLKKIDIFLPADEAISDLIIQLNALANQSKLTLTRVDIASTAEQAVSGESVNSLISASDSVSPINIHMELQGKNDYLSLKNFISLLEKNMRLLDITDMTLAPQESGFTVDLRTYYLPRS